MKRYFIKLINTFRLILTMSITILISCHSIPEHNELLSIQNKQIKVNVERHGTMVKESILIRLEDNWVPVLGADEFASSAQGYIPSADDIILFDMENGNDGKWVLTEGNLPYAFTKSRRTDFSQVGNGFIGTTEMPDNKYDDQMTGVLESASFKVTKDYLTMLVSGGNHKNQTYVAIIDNQTKEEIIQFYGENTEKFRRVRCDVSAYKGKELFIRVVDRNNGRWGHINLDDVVMTDTPPPGVFDPPYRFQITDIQSSREGTADAIRITGRCKLGKVIRELRTDAEEDIINVHTTFHPENGYLIQSIEDRLDFLAERQQSPAPSGAERHTDNNPLSGPLDFVWSQGIKARVDNINAHWLFKSPVVMLQQGKAFAALVPDIDSLTRESLLTAPLALDLDVTQWVTQQTKPWLSCGIVPVTPWSHSYFIRSGSVIENKPGKPIEYAYRIIASAQPEFQGYRRIVRFLWAKYGQHHFKETIDLQRNVKQKELYLFDDWRREAWQRYANEVYREFDYDGTPCAVLVSSRNKWANKVGTNEDAWFNHWFQTLRTAYGWYRYGRRTNNTEMMTRAERILNLALKAPQQKEGVFPTIYYRETDGSHHWVIEDGWAGFTDYYHTFDMSWTAYWMLCWARDLLPERKNEILTYCRSYAEFLVKNQIVSGCIPSWYDKDLKPKTEFNEFNAETSCSALFLAELYTMTKEQKYLDVAQRAMDFVTREVLPRHRWYDFETFLSCARKPLNFYDSWTAQYPQNWLSINQAAMAYLRLYQINGDNKYLDLGTRVCDYQALY
ncbi:MAG: hypothetical protein V1709_11980, partial [Planctomycetota bacterium]